MKSAVIWDDTGNCQQDFVRFQRNRHDLCQSAHDRNQGLGGAEKFTSFASFTKPCKTIQGKQIGSCGICGAITDAGRMKKSTEIISVDFYWDVAIKAVIFSVFQ